MKVQALMIACLLTLTSAGFAQEGPVPKGVACDATTNTMSDLLGECNR